MHKMASFGLSLVVATGFVACNSTSPVSPSAFPSGGGATTITGTAHTAGATAALSFGQLSHAGSDDPVEVCVVGADLCAVADESGYFELVGNLVGDLRLRFSSDDHDVVVTIHDVQLGQTIRVTVSLNGQSGTLEVDSREGGGERVCHREGNGGFHLIQVDASALRAHEDHGDGYPGEAVPTEPPLKFDLQCGIPRPDVEIEKATNGEDADTVPGPRILVNDSGDFDVEWTYVVTNTGDVPLTNVIVTDLQGVVVTCRDEDLLTLMPHGEPVTCVGRGTATLGQYTNTGTVTADFVNDLGTLSVSDDDLSHYLGIDGTEEETEEEAGPKVALCHRRGNGDYHLIEVGAAAAPAHMAHGDRPPNPEDGSCTFSDAP